MLVSEEVKCAAFSGVWSGTDIDGDTFIAVNHSMTPDFSECQWSMHGGTGNVCRRNRGVGSAYPAAQPLVMAVTAKFPGKGNGSCHNLEEDRLFSWVNRKSDLLRLKDRTMSALEPVVKGYGCFNEGSIEGLAALCHEGTDVQDERKQ